MISNLNISDLTEHLSKIKRLLLKDQLKAKLIENVEMMHNTEKCTDFTGINMHVEP